MARSERARGNCGRLLLHHTGELLLGAAELKGLCQQPFSSVLHPPLLSSLFHACTSQRTWKAITPGKMVAAYKAFASRLSSFSPLTNGAPTFDTMSRCSPFCIRLLRFLCHALSFSPISGMAGEGSYHTDWSTWPCYLSKFKTINHIQAHSFSCIHLSFHSRKMHPLLRFFRAEC